MTVGGGTQRRLTWPLASEIVAIGVTNQLDWDLDRRRDRAVGCCGQKRAALRRRTMIPAASRKSVTVEPSESDTSGLPATSVMVEYRGIATAVLHRASSGRLYTFSLAHPARLIRAADAGQLLLNQDFCRIQH